MGNHLLIPDFGLTLRGARATWRLYTPTIFDKGVGDSATTDQRDKLQGLKTRSRDHLVGLSWERPWAGLKSALSARQAKRRIGRRLHGALEAQLAIKISAAGSKVVSQQHFLRNQVFGRRVGH